MKCISAYDFNDRLVEGHIYTNKKGESYIISNLGESLNIKDIKTYRIYEELEGDEVQDFVNKDLSELNVDDNDKLKNLLPQDLEKTAEKREKELQDKGLEIKDDDYKDKFVNSVNAAEAANGTSMGTISDSVALKKVLEDTDIYATIYKEIDKYTESVSIFDENKLLEQICNKLNIKSSMIKGDSLSESIKNIVKLKR